MKRSAKAVTITIAAAILIATVLAVVTYTTGASWRRNMWYCGAGWDWLKVTATFRDDGTFVVSGKGAMKDYFKLERMYGTNYIPIDLLTPWENIKDRITDLIIEDGVTHIGGNAFYVCDELKSVAISNSVVSIGYSAFAVCNELKSITIPNSVRSIGRFAFRNCNELKSITIPNSVSSIGEWAFRDCNKLTSIDVNEDNSVYSSIDGVLFNKAKDTLIQYPRGKQGAYTIPSGVTAIVGYLAFLGSHMTSVTIPISMKSLKEEFYACSSLTSINVSNDHPVYSSVDGVLFNKTQDTLIFYPRGKQGAYAIPNSVKTIKKLAFYGNNRLTSVTIPSSVTQIGSNAFDKCPGLMAIINLNTVPPVVDFTIGSFVKQVICLYVPESSVDNYRNADRWKEFECIKPLSVMPKMFHNANPVNTR